MIRKFYKLLETILTIIHNAKFIIPNRNIDSIKYEILIDIHCIEKGLGMPEVRLGFGKAHIKKILAYIDRKNTNTDDYVYQYCLSVISSYIKFHKENNYDVKELENIYKKFAHLNLNVIKSGAYNVVTQPQNSFNVLAPIIQSRHSVRDFSNKNIDEITLIKAFELSKFAPSACDRQTSKVYYTLEPSKNTQIGNLFPGNNGFRDKVKMYLVITGNIGAFRSDEYGQWFTNVGIYAYCLSLILHSLGIGSCMLQWTTNLKNERELRKILNIPENEQIVLSLAIGYYKNNYKRLVATRKNISDFIIKLS